MQAHDMGDQPSKRSTSERHRAGQLSNAIMQVDPVILAWISLCVSRGSVPIQK